jgi:hypothetical protein
VVFSMYVCKYAGSSFGTCTSLDISICMGHWKSGERGVKGRGDVL